MQSFLQKPILFVVLFGVVATSGITNAAIPAPLTPSGPWKVDYAEDECRLIREFGAGDSAVALRIARGATLDTYDMMIAGLSLPYGTVRREVTLTANPLNVTTTFNAEPYSIKDSKIRIWRWFDLEAAFVDKIDDRQTLSFVGKGKINVHLRTPGLAKAMSALQVCHDDLLTKVYKLDLVALRALAKGAMPIGYPGDWVTHNDYPGQALMAGQNGTTRFTILVGPDGVPQSCTVVVSSGHAILDKAACDKIMQRARFSPAETKEGKKVAAPWLRSVRWVIP